MAMIQKIRDNSLLTLIVIGGAVFAFILTDFLSSNPGSKIDNSVGSFEGVEITNEDFRAEREKIVFLTNPGQNFSSVQDFQKGQYTNQTWNSILRDRFLLNECKELGITITGNEEEDMLAGQQPSPFFVNYLFGGQSKYEQNRQQISSDPSNFAKFAYLGQRNQQGQVVNEIPLGQNAYWVKDFGVKLRIQDKFQRILSSCFYTTSSLAKDEFVSNNSTKDVQIAYVNLNTISDSSANPTDSDIKAAYNELKSQFVKKEETRKLLFAKFDLQPSQTDRSNVIKSVASLKQTLIEEKESKLFIKNESETTIDLNFYKKGEFTDKTAGIDTLMFNLNKGDVYGPFTNPAQSKFGVAKVLDVKLLADSAKINSFLISPMTWYEKIVTDPQDQKQAADFRKAYREGADSLAALIKANPASIATIPKDFWLDTVAIQKKGNIGWIQTNFFEFGKNFNDSVFFGKTGDVKVVPVSFQKNQQFLSILHIEKFGEKVKKMQIGVITKNVTPGDETLDEYMGKANQVAFALKDGFKITSLRDSLQFVVDSLDVTGSTFSLRGVLDSRKVINWAFNTELNQPSNVFTTPNSYLVAIVTDENSSEYKSLDDETVKYTCEDHARRSKQRKEVLKNFPEVTAENITQFPSLYKGGLVNNSSAVKIKQGVSQFSRESKVTGAIAGLNAGEVSEIIEGEYGVYVIYVAKENNAEITEDNTFEVEKNQIKGTTQRIGGLLLDEYVTEKSDLSDNRKTLR